MTTNTTQTGADAINVNAHTTRENFPTSVTEGKALATQIAQLTLAGHVVHKGKSGDFLVCKFGLSRWCKDFAELQAFSRKLAVTQ